MPRPSRIPLKISRLSTAIARASSMKSALMVLIARTSFPTSLSSTVVVRTAVLAPDQMKDLERDLEKEIASALFGVFYAPVPAAEERVGSVSITLMDEDPKSRALESGGIDAKGQFDALGQALSSASQSTLGPILQDLSFLYGGRIENDGASTVTRGSVIDT